MAKKEPGNWLPIDLYVERDIHGIVPALVNNPKTLLAIDPGTKNLAACFILITDFTRIIETTKFDIPVFPTTFQRIQYLEAMVFRWVTKLLQFHHAKLDILIKESIAHGYAGGVADAGRVQQMLEHLATWNLGVPFFDVNPTSMRAFIGSKSKSDTKLQVYKKYHVEFPSEDECDVFAIAMTGLAMLSGEYEKKKKVRKK